MNEQNYHYSGKSTPEAIEDFKEHKLSHFPKFLRPLLENFIQISIVCDGCGQKTQLQRPERTPDGRWKDSEWVHRENLDFCETCSANGTADRAIAAGVKPLGAYTLGDDAA